MKKILITVLLASTILLSSEYSDNYIFKIKDYSVEQKIVMLSEEAIRIQLSQPSDARILGQYMFDLARKSQNQKLISDALYYWGYIQYRWLEYDSAQYYIKKSLKIREEINYPLGIGISLNRLGNIYWRQNKTDSAIQNFKRALEIHREYDHYKEAGMACNNLGNSYRQQQNYEKTLEYFIQASEYYEKSNFTEGLAWLHFSTANLYKRLDEYDKALDFSKKALAIYKSISTQRDSNGVMLCYNQIGDIYLRLKQYNLSLDYQFKSLRIRKKMDMKIAIADGMTSIGRTYFMLQDYDRAKYFLNESVKLREEANSFSGHSTSLQHIAKINLIQGDTASAEALFYKALDYTNEYGELITKRIILKALTDIHSAKGEIEKSLEKSMEYNTLQDSLHKQAMSDKVAMMKLNYELREKDRENNYLQQQNIINGLEIEKNIAQRRFYNALMISSIILMMILLLLYNKIHSQNNELKDSLNNIKTLKGLIPICSKCKKIRNDQGFYEHLDLYLQAHTDAELSHGICPDCMEELYGSEEWYKKNMNKRD